VVASGSAIEPHAAPKLANINPPMRLRTRNVLSRMVRVTTEVMAWRYGVTSLGRVSRGRTMANHAATPSITTAATAKTARQPQRSAMNPETVRASRIPRTTPVVTTPTVRPRLPGGLAAAANAVIT
jgi:hypothetical protein